MAAEVSNMAKAPPAKLVVVGVNNVASQPMFADLKLRAAAAAAAHSAKQKSSAYCC